ncbi:protein MGARP [Gracilinanus agilis]|uniref:protein MGARP n=1 Tax=Gracilinanus agilis TaxID=191870 RepID=UPI001CFE94DD|nr:protein MGARP [Gracilinanus agilis]
MYLRRAVGKTLTLPLRTAPSSPPLLWKHASLREMSSKKAPGSGGSNMIYYLFVGVTFSAGGYYAYRTVTSDQARYTERINNMQMKSAMRDSPPEMLQPPDEEVKPMETNEACSEAPTDASPLEVGLATVEENIDLEDAALEETPAVSVEVGPEETPAISGEAGPQETPAISGEAGPEETPAISAEAGPEEAPASSVEAGPEEAPAGSVEAGPEEAPAGSVEVGPEETPEVSVEAGPEETPEVSVKTDPEISEAAIVSAESEPEVTDAAMLEAAEVSDKAPEAEEALAADTEMEEEKKSPPEAEICAEAEL